MGTAELLALGYEIEGSEFPLAELIPTQKPTEFIDPNAPTEYVQLPKKKSAAAFIIF